MCADTQRRAWKMRVQDILDSIGKIKTYIDGLSFAQFEHDALRIDAVIRNLEIIGEAAGHIPLEIQAQYPDIAWLEMRGMRNIVAHEYFGVSLLIIWRTITHDFAILEDQFQRLLKEQE